MPGAGTVSFRWRVDCEWDDSGDATWDHVAFSVDGVEVVRMDGDSGWRNVSHDIAGAGAHTLRWAFLKDDYNDADLADRAWVGGVTWTPSVPSVAGDPTAVAGDASGFYSIGVGK